MAFPALCVEIVTKKLNPPVMCTEKFCGEVVTYVDGSCHKLKWPAGQPFLCRESSGRVCYCCCSCFSFDTPIEVSPAVFERAETIVSGQQIRAAGLSLNWGQRAVSEVSHIAPSGAAVQGMYAVRFRLPGETDERVIVMASDDLLLIPTTPRSLKPVYQLRPGDSLVAATGATATVVGVSGGSLARGIASIQMGPFDGKNLDGHLLNTNGVVAADYAVQVWYSSDQLDASLLSPRELDPPEQMPIEVDEEWLADPEAWPAGFTPFTRPSFKPPVNAWSFLTHQQARDVQVNAEQTSPENTIVAMPLLYLFQVARAFNPTATFLLDWGNQLPNAYAWEEWGDHVVVFTGGLVRILALDREGLALVLADMLAYREEKIDCVGPADLLAATTEMRAMWSDDLYMHTILPGIEQIRAVFANVNEEHAGPGRNICRQPALACRLETFEAGVSVGPLPGCAEPPTGPADALAAS